MEYKDKLRAQILIKLEDLKKKIKTNQPCPESDQNIELLIEIDVLLEVCLRPWNY